MQRRKNCNCSVSFTAGFALKPSSFQVNISGKDATKSQNPKQGVGDLLYDDRMVLDQSVFVDPHKITSVFGGSSRGVAVSVEPLELA